MALPYQFNNTQYQAGFVGTDDGAPAATFGINDVNTSAFTVNGTVRQVGDPVSVTGVFPGDDTATTRTFYATRFDNANQIQFNDSQNGPYTRANIRLVLSNMQLGGNSRFTSDGNGTLGDYNAVCFASGTRILTARGEIAVENLAVGDLAVTASGAQRPIRWIGSRSIDPRRHPRPHEAQPVRIRAHALGDNKPARDLVISPGHAIALDLVGEVLIPAYALVNGSTVVQEEVDSVTYWHVELDSHDILLAEGLPAESYLDMGNRGFFAGGRVVALDAGPDADPSLRTHADFCRPFHDGGPLVDAVHVQMRRRAEAQGWRLARPETWAEAYLEVDGRRVLPKPEGLSACFELPSDAGEVWLVSGTSVPQAVGMGPDNRALGLSLTGLSLDDGLAPARNVALDDPRLGEGFHAFQGDHRWTAGRARLPAALWADLQSTVFLRIDLGAPALPRWTAPEAGGAAEGIAA